MIAIHESRDLTRLTVPPLRPFSDLLSDASLEGKPITNLTFNKKGQVINQLHMNDHKYRCFVNNVIKHQYLTWLLNNQVTL